MANGFGASVRVYASRNALADAVADRIGALVEARQFEVKPLVLGLASGASPAGVYRELARRVHRNELDLSRCLAFCLDEYYPVGSEDPRSYAQQMSRVATELGILPGSLRIPRGDTPREQLEAHCGQYEEAIWSAGGIDFQFLGVGRSGHVAFNEPGSSRASRTRLVELDDRTRRDAAAAFGGLERCPREAITMGIATILEAREIALIAIGGLKAEIVRRLIEEPPSAVVPASLLQGHDGVTVHLDADASRLLDRATVGDNAVVAPRSLG